LGRRLRRPVGLSVYFFLLFFIAGTAISVGTGVFAYRVASEAYLERAKESLWNTSNTARDVILHVWLPLVTRKTALAASSLVSGNLSLGDRASLSRALADIYRNFPEFRRLNLYNLDGVLLASSDPLFQEGGIDFSRRIQVGEVGLLPLRRAGPGEEEVISFVLPMKRDGMNAYLVADLDVKVVNQEISSKRVGISGEIYLVDERGRLVTYPRYGLEAYGVKVLGEPLETEGVRRATAGESGISVYRNYLGEEVLGCYSWIPEVKWGVLVEEPTSSVLAPLGTVRRSIILAVLACLAASLAIAFFSYRWLGKPIRLVAKAAERVASGEEGVRLQPRGAGELRGLAEDFNRMAEGIENSTRFLERKVEERTHELMSVINAAAELRSSREPFPVLARTLDFVQDITGSQDVWSYLASGEEYRLMAKRVSSPAAPPLPESLDPSREPWAFVLRKRGPVPVEDPGTGAGGDLALNCLPLATQQRVLGLVVFALPHGEGRLSGHTGDILSVVAFESALALENAILYRELREKVEALEEANRELKSLDQAKNDFISMITHELKQPLALISGYAQTIHDYYEELSVEDEMQCIRVIVERAEYLSRMVDDLLDLSAIKQGVLRIYPESLDLRELAEQVVSRFAGLYPWVRFVTDFPPDFPRLMADARRMEQVLTNLVANAVKFSDEKGEVEVRGSPGEDEVMVEVMDRGRGIDPEKVDRIFDPFFQEDFSIRRPYPGVGLGLHVCRQLVVAHGGRIWAENREGGGARFVFTLPLRAGEREGGV